MRIQQSTSLRDFEKKEERPRFRFARIISSNNLIEGSSARFVCRSYRNSLNAMIEVSVDRRRATGQRSPCESRSMSVKLAFSPGTLLINPSILKPYNIPFFFCSAVGATKNLR